MPHKHINVSQLSLCKSQEKKELNSFQREKGDRFFLWVDKLILFPVPIPVPAKGWVKTNLERHFLTFHYGIKPVIILFYWKISNWIKIFRPFYFNFKKTLWIVPMLQKKSSYSLVPFYASFLLLVKISLKICFLLKWRRWAHNFFWIMLSIWYERVFYSI